MGPEGQETVRRLLPPGAPNAVAPPRALLDCTEEDLGLAHLRVDLSESAGGAGGAARSDGRVAAGVAGGSGSGGALHGRAAWYAEAWRSRCPAGACAEMPPLRWPLVVDLLREAVEVHGYSRFAARGGRWDASATAEAAALLRVYDWHSLVPFRSLCVTAEAPEPWRITGTVAKAVASSALPWSVELYSKVVLPLFPQSQFRQQVALLASGRSVSGRRLARQVWLVVISFLARDLAPDS